MARSKPKAKTGARRPKKTTVGAPLNPLRPGMPAQDSITSVEQFGRGKKTLRVIHTKEVDEYDR